MSRISQRLMQFGWWDLNLKKGVSDALLKKLMDNPWGEVYITSKRFPKPFHTKAGLKSVSQFTGILWSITRDPVSGTLAIAGPSNTAWLGDPDKNRGDLRKVMVTFTAEPVVDAVTALLPTSVTAGSIQSPVPGQSMNTKHYLQPTKADIQMIADLTGGEWRVNPNGTVDFGTQTQLGYAITPRAVVFPRSVGNSLTGLPVLAPTSIYPIKATKVETLLDVQDYITEALVLGEGAGYGTIVFGEGIAATVPYKDPNGNELIWRETFDIPVLSITDADTKAQQVVDDKAVLRQALTLDLSDFVMGGTYSIGDYLYIYDPPMMQDLAVSLPFGSGYIHPTAIRLLSADFGIGPGRGVYFRDHLDVIHDLSDLFEPDTGAPRFEVGEFKRSATNTSLAASIALDRLTSGGDDPLAPAEIVTLAEYASGAVFSPTTGYTAWEQLQWDPTTTNEDASPMVDGSHYTVRYGEKALIDADEPWTYGPHIPLTDFLPGADPIQVWTQISGLRVGVEYYFQVHCIDLNGNGGAWSMSATITTPVDLVAPLEPSVPVVVGVGSNGVELTHDLLDAASDPFADDVSSLRVYLEDATPVTINAAHRAGTINVPYADIKAGSSVTGRFDGIGPAASRTPLVRGVTYYMAVVAVDEAGNASDPSVSTAGVVAGDHTAPATSTDLAIEAYLIEGRYGSLRASWTASTEPDLHHYVLRYRRVSVGEKWTRIPRIDSDDTEIIVDGLLVGRNYRFQIRAVDAHTNRSAWSGNADIAEDWGLTGPEPPPQPTMVAVPGGFDVTFDLSVGDWGTDNPEAKFIRVYIGTTSEPNSPKGKIMLDYEDDLEGEGEVTFQWRPGQVDATKTWYARGKAWDWAGNPGVG